MTGNISDSTAATDRTVLGVPLEPARFREREDVAYDERRYVHDDETHCAADAAGRLSSEEYGPSGASSTASTGPTHRTT